MKVYVYPTDRNWYRFLSTQPNLYEVNFWRPGGKLAFRQLTIGDLFLFRLGAPDYAIAGGGFFTHFTFAPLTTAWDLFGTKNGTPDFESFAVAVKLFISTVCHSPFIITLQSCDNNGEILTQSAIVNVASMLL